MVVGNPGGILDAVSRGATFEHEDLPGYLKIDEIVGRGPTRKYILHYYFMPRGRDAGEIAGIFVKTYTAHELEMAIMNGELTLF